ncbi:MAG: DNA mismatch repair endonuclease MutL [bacterium]
MAKIIVLPENVASKIAAGEVISRPASVVKELLENSIDAGATRIDIAIEAGGSKLIMVRDNGCGMDPEDASLAFERHATSKLNRPEDLDRITTLGFRGEALPSIAAISQVELITKTSDGIAGTRIVIHGGRALEKEEAGSSSGTIVSVKNLFYNVPARRKYLKSPTTEMGHIIRIVGAEALARPDVHFTLSHNGVNLLDLPPGTLIERISTIFSRSLAERLIEIEGEKDNLGISGYVSPTDVRRQNKQHILCFVNRRNVYNKTMYHAIMSAYHTLLPEGTYPFAILFLEIDPSFVDVNVHPTKSEVRFLDDQRVYKFVFDSIRNTLVPEKPKEKPRTMFQEIRSRTTEDSESPIARAITHPIYYTVERAEPRVDFTLPRPITQIDNTYILAQDSEGIIIIDQHAAHERVIYDRMISQYEAREIKQQILLVPITVELSKQESEILKEYMEDLKALGYDIDVFGGNVFIVRAVPQIGADYNEETIRDIIDNILATGRIENDKRVERLIFITACRASKMSGERLPPNEMESLIRQLYNTKSPYTCPHGRPTVVKLTVSELARRFGRV